MWIGKRHVDEYALHDDKDSCSVESDANDRGDPRNRRFSCPGEDEETDRRPKGGEESRDESVLLCSKTALHNIGDEVEVEIAGVDGNADDTRDEDTGEEDTEGTDTEAVKWDIDEGEDFKEGVVNSIDQTSVKIDKSNSRVLESDFKGFDQSVNDYGRDFHALLINFALSL